MGPRLSRARSRAAEAPWSCSRGGGSCRSAARASGRDRPASRRSTRPRQHRGRARHAAASPASSSGVSRRGGRPLGRSHSPAKPSALQRTTASRSARRSMAASRAASARLNPSNAPAIACIRAAARPSQPAPPGAAPPRPHRLRPQAPRPSFPSREPVKSRPSDHKNPSRATSKDRRYQRQDRLERSPASSVRPGAAAPSSPARRASEPTAFRGVLRSPGSFATATIVRPPVRARSTASRSNASGTAGPRSETPAVVRPRPCRAPHKVLRPRSTRPPNEGRITVREKPRSASWALTGDNAAPC